MHLGLGGPNLTEASKNKQVVDRLLMSMSLATYLATLYTTGLKVPHPVAASNYLPR